MKPRLLLSPFTHLVYLSTRYRERPDGVVEAITKTDVTEEFERACLAHLARLAGGTDGHKYLLDGLTALVEKVRAKESVA